MTVDRNSERIDSTGDLARETVEIGSAESEATTPKKPLISPVVKWVLIADVVIAAIAVAVFMLV